MTDSQMTDSQMADSKMTASQPADTQGPEGEEHPGLNIAALFDTVAQRIPEREAIVFRDRRISYGELLERTRRLAHALRDRGLGPHAADRTGYEPYESHMDHLAIYAHNGNEYLESILGAFTTRVAPVNVNYRYVAGELAHLLRDSTARGIVYHSAFAPTLAEVLPDLPDLTVLIQIPDESGNELLPGAEWYDDVIASGSAQRPAWSSDWSPDDLYVLYTGGTTGLPKGVLWRQADIHRASLGGRDVTTREAHTDIEVLAETAAGPRQSVIMTGAPLMHGAGQWVTISGLLQGNTVVIQNVVDRLDPADMCATIEREKVSFFQIVGDALGRPIVEELEKGDYDVSSLVVLLSGGAVLSSSLRNRFLALLPNVILVDGLGSSEGGGQGIQVTMGTPSGSSTAFQPSTGSVVVSDDMTRVLDPTDDTVGWLAKRTDAPLGYFGDPDKTAQTFPVIAGERMSVPGDRARWNPDGTVELLGRESATINSGGEKIFAEEVESALLAHASVADVVVVGRPSPRWGQEVAAVVQLHDGHDVDPSELAEFLGGSLARYKIPKAWVFVERIQRSPAGKADHRWARDQALAG